MKKTLNNPITIALLIIIAIATLVWAAAWQDYGAFSGDIADTDDWLIRDISATPPANGTVKRLPWSQLKTQIGNNANFWTGSAQTYLSGEIVVNDESTLYNALSDVSRFYEANDADPEWGVNDTTQGIHKIYGNSTTGGAINYWYNSAGEDTNEEYWTCQANGDQFECGPESDPDLYIRDRNGTYNPSAAPRIEFNDTSHDAGGIISVNSIDANDAEMLLGVDDSSGDNTTYIDIDGVNERVGFIVPIDAPSINAGMDVEVYTTNTDLEGEQCSKLFILSGTAAADVTLTLMAEPECEDGTGSGKILSFYNNDVTYDLLIDPDGTDTITIPGVGSCGAGDPVCCDAFEAVTFVGYADSLWFPLGTTSCECDSCSP